MDLFEWLKGQYRRTSTSATVGWLPGAESAEGFTYGHGYVRLWLTDFAIAHSKDAFVDRHPVMLAAVSMNVGDKLVPVATTLGPASMQDVGGTNGFRRLAHHNVPLTGLVPLNSGVVTVLAGLLSAPGTSDIDAIATFLGKLGDLVKVPQLSMVIDVATTVADGVTDLLGGGTTSGVLGLHLGFGPADLRSNGYYVMVDPGEHDSPSITHLRVVNDQLVRYPDAKGEGTPLSMDGWSYLVLRMTVEADCGDSWQDLDVLRPPMEAALTRLHEAQDDDALKAAFQSMLAAQRVAAFAVDLSIADRERVAGRIAATWLAALQKKRAMWNSLKGPALPEVAADEQPTPDSGAGESWAPVNTEGPVDLDELSDHTDQAMFDSMTRLEKELEPLVGSAR